jgi:PKD domain
MLRLTIAVTIGLALVVLAPPAAFAQPANDDFDNATAVSSLPFTTSQDTSGATAALDDPTFFFCSNNGSVWFSFTPATDMTIEADTFGSDYDTELSVYTGTRGSLSLVSCSTDFFGPQSMVIFPASAGTTYFFMVAACCGTGGTGGGNLVFTMNLPANDDFANATVITDLPFSDNLNTGAATTEPDEPSCNSASNTVWYAFTPSITQTITASVSSFFSGSLAAYTGSSLSSLTQVGCGFDRVTLRATAGTTYYFQVGVAFGSGGPLQFELDVASPPVASFGFQPSDPSVFDTVHFSDASFDPGGVGIQSQVWSFGDGATAEGCCPTHQYAQDGDYTVGLTVTTPDGRTGSTSQVVQVRTHDVAIVKIGVPKSAHVGQAIAVNVEVRNTRYPETVQVELFKGVAGGVQQIGSLTQSVAVRSGNRTTRFPFTYLVTQADRSVGKVSFKAVATIIDHREALPGDNELTSPPVRVT